MTARTILQIFDNYQKSRMQFIQSVAELAVRPQNLEMMMQFKVLELIKPLLSDISIQIQQCAAIALGRLVHHNEKVGEQILQGGFLPILLRNFDKQTKYYKKSVLFALRSICKHSPEMAMQVSRNGGMEAFIVSLEDFEPVVKEGAAWALGYIARHNQTLAQSVVDAGVVPLLVFCLQEPELSLKQIATNVLVDIAKHTVDLAQFVVDAGAVPHLVKSLNNVDEKLKGHVLAALSAISKHSVELAEVVVEGEIFPNVLMHMAHACPTVRRNATILVRDIVKHSLELTQLVVNTGGIGALVEVLSQGCEECLIPNITALGYIAGHSEQLAMSMISCTVVVLLDKILEKEVKNDTLLAVTAWTIGQIGKHSSEHANVIASENMFPKLLEFYQSTSSSHDLRSKCKATLKHCLQKCLLLSALEPLLYDAPTSIMKYILGQYSKVLPNDPKARRLFVTSGGLRKVQEVDAEPGSTLMEYITLINQCFPEEIVRYYSPGYPETLLEKVEQYSPQMAGILNETGVRNSDMQTDVAVLLDKSNRSYSEELQDLIHGD